MPERIQLRRTKGWRKPEGAIVVARPTKWGNPFQIGSNRPDVFVHDGMGVHWSTPRDEDADELARQFAVSMYHSWLESGSVHGLSRRQLPAALSAVRSSILGDIKTLYDRDLACWCALDQPCHADVLLQLANQEVA